MDSERRIYFILFLDNGIFSNENEGQEEGIRDFVFAGRDVLTWGLLRLFLCHMFNLLQAIFMDLKCII